MSAILGLILLVIGIAALVFGIQVLFHDKNDFKHNHKITGNLSNAISGTLDKTKVSSPDEISLGFTMDMRTSELVPCSQLSKESIK
jgi:hypothetical protein